MNITGIDLNLLIAFESLLDERHVGRAANRVGLSQPAFSNAISRLRVRLDDPLFVRTARGMLPTPRAAKIRDHVVLKSLCRERLRPLQPPEDQVATGRKQDAIASFRRAIDLDPDYEQAHRNLGILLAIDGSLADAEQELKLALVIDPKDTAAEYVITHIRTNKISRP